MLVRARGMEGVVVGYHAHKRRRGGDVFNLNDKKHFSKKWMEEVKGGKKEDTALDREAIKANLAELEVEFAGNAKTETLQALLEKTVAENE